VVNSFDYSRTVNFKHLPLIDAQLMQLMLAARNPKPVRNGTRGCLRVLGISRFSGGNPDGVPPGVPPGPGSVTLRADSACVTEPRP
jgi:hypothetical protein